MIFFNLIFKVIYYTILVLFIGFTIFIFVYSKSIRNNLDILPIISPNECKVISSIYKSLLVTLALTSIKHGNVDATPMWCNVYDKAYVDGEFTGSIKAKALCDETKGVSRFTLVGIMDNDNPFDLKENSKVNSATATICVLSSLSGVTSAVYIGWGCEHQNLINVSQCKKLSKLVVAISASISAGTCGSWVNSG